MVKSHEPMNKLDENHWVIKKTSQGDEWELQEWEEEGNRSD